MKMHTGIDFTAKIGTEIFATGDGIVTTAIKSRTGYGNHVVIKHGFGYQTLYAHLNRIDVRVGQKIKRGNTIGSVGNTGTSTAPHLHYEVIQNGKKVDPINFFFNDLTYDEYKEIIKISQSAINSMD
jgi:murein DD-endopeptidase MepM/ murein hydrolase activator NlpD